MGRKPEGAQALTGADDRPAIGHATPTHRTLRRHSARHPTKARAMSRAQQWDMTVAALVTLQAGYAAWLEAMPEATRDSRTGEALQAIVDLDLDELIAIRPPRGFGRD